MTDRSAASLLPLAGCCGKGRGAEFRDARIAGGEQPQGKSAFARMPKKAVVRLWHRAHDFDRRTRQPGSGKHGGAVGLQRAAGPARADLGFLNFATGRLDPSYAGIARKTNVCAPLPTPSSGSEASVSSIGYAGVPGACAMGRFVLEQETNAYAVLPDS